MGDGWDSSRAESTGPWHRAQATGTGAVATVLSALIFVGMLDPGRCSPSPYFRAKGLIMHILLLPAMPRSSQRHGESTTGTEM